MRKNPADLWPWWVRMLLVIAAVSAAVLSLAACSQAEPPAPQTVTATREVHPVAAAECFADDPPQADLRSGEPADVLADISASDHTLARIRALRGACRASLLAQAAPKPAN